MRFPVLFLVLGALVTLTLESHHSWAQGDDSGIVGLEPLFWELDPSQQINDGAEWCFKYDYATTSEGFLLPATSTLACGYQEEAFRHADESYRRTELNLQTGAVEDRSGLREDYASYVPASRVVYPPGFRDIWDASVPLGDSSHVYWRGSDVIYRGYGTSSIGFFLNDEDSSLIMGFRDRGAGGLLGVSSDVPQGVLPFDVQYSSWFALAHRSNALNQSGLLGLERAERGIPVDYAASLPTDVRGAGTAFPGVFDLALVYVGPGSVIHKASLGTQTGAGEGFDELEALNDFNVFGRRNNDFFNVKRMQGRSVFRRPNSTDNYAKCLGDNHYHWYLSFVGSGFKGSGGGSSGSQNGVRYCLEEIRGDLTGQSDQLSLFSYVCRGRNDEGRVDSFAADDPLLHPSVFCRNRNSKMDVRRFTFGKIKNDSYVDTNKIFGGSDPLRCWSNGTPEGPRNHECLVVYGFNDSESLHADCRDTRGWFGFWRYEDGHRHYDSDEGEDVSGLLHFLRCLHYDADGNELAIDGRSFFRFFFMIEDKDVCWLNLMPSRRGRAIAFDASGCS